MKKYFEILLAGFCVVFFPLRDFLCKSLYPKMKTITGEWDGANNLTMDLFAWMFFCGIFLSWRHTTGILSVFLGASLGFSAGDVLDRLFGIRDYTGFDFISVPLAIIIPIYTYVSYRKHSK